MDTFVPAPGVSVAILNESILILPCVSIGNVPQLTSDLLIHTLHWQRIGFLDDDALMAVAGCQENGSGVSVPAEVFQSNDRKFTLVQLRAPVRSNKKNQWVKNLASFIEKHKFQQVVLLTSADAARRVDSQITSSPFRYLSNDTSNNPVAQSASQNDLIELETQENPDPTSILPGSGAALAIYNALVDQGRSTSMIIMFALEGDNVQDSVMFANTLDTLLHVNPGKQAWTPPKSWDYLFGMPFDEEMYQ